MILLIVGYVAGVPLLWLFERAAFWDSPASQFPRGYAVALAIIWPPVVAISIIAVAGYWAWRLLRWPRSRLDRLGIAIGKWIDEKFK